VGNFVQVLGLIVAILLGVYNALIEYQHRPGETSVRAAEPVDEASGFSVNSGAEPVESRVFSEEISP
jgi:hypothetical protein